MNSFFWMCALGIVYSYFLYPIALLFLARKNHGVVEDCQGDTSKISVIIAAHNEADGIGAKLDDTLSAEFPLERYEILVASDASDDGTDEIVSRYADRGVRLVRADERKGKEHAQRLAVLLCKDSDILVFSDVATRFPRDSLIKISKIFFCNNDIGAVSSEDCFLSDDGQPTGESAYVKYEMALRRLESRVAGLVGLSGSFFAVRRDVCDDWNTEIPSDFNVAIASVKRGYRSISHPGIVGLYPAIMNASHEYVRKVRTVNRGMAALIKRIEILNPFRYRLFSFQIFSHKIMRWLVPIFYFGAWFASITLIGQGIVYVTSAIVLSVVPFAALIGWRLPKLQKFTVVRIPYYFVQVNLAVLHATLLFLLGQRITKWQPSER